MTEITHIINNHLKVNLLFGAASEYCNLDYAKLQHCHTDRKVTELLNADSNEGQKIKVLSEYNLDSIW